MDVQNLVNTSLDFLRKQKKVVLMDEEILSGYDTGAVPGLFKDESYIDIISENIKKQMVKQNKSDENKIYWVKGIENETETDLFENIKKDQSFYINKDSKLVISFNKFEVDPGYMGVVEFVIPTDVIVGNMGNDYIR